MTISMDSLVRSVSEPLEKIQQDLKAILSIPDIGNRLPKEQKESKFKKIISFRKKKDEIKSEGKVIVEDEEKSGTETTDEVLRELQSGAEGKPDELDELIEKAVEPSGGFVLTENEPEQEVKEEQTKVEQPKESNPMRLKPPIFDEILKGIDLKRLAFKEGEFDKFSYNELNESYGWIVKYRKWMESEERDIPNTTYAKQKIIEDIIYRAIFAKMEKHQVQTQKETQTPKEDNKDD